MNGLISGAIEPEYTSLPVDALARHPNVDMMSFTGSTRAGILAAKAAADTVKPVALELGGRSANILPPDVDFAPAIPKGGPAASATAANPATRRPGCSCPATGRTTSRPTP